MELIAVFHGLLWVGLLSLFTLFFPSVRRDEKLLTVLFIIDTVLFALTEVLLPGTPFSGPGYCLFIASLLAGGGMLLAGWSRSETLGEAERTGVLLRIGIYRRLRHPRYGGILIISAGLALKRPSPLLACCWIVIWVLCRRLVRREERALARRFGTEWDRYRRGTGRFLPRIVR